MSAPPATHQSHRHSTKKHYAEPIFAPPIVRATAALAWLVSAVCFIRAASLWFGGVQEFADSVFFLGLGGGAAYLGLALPRRVVSAWRTCRDLAAATGTINMVVLPALVVAGALAVGFRLYSGLDPSLADWTVKLCVAAVATAVPWMFYHALGDDRVRSWFCAVDCR
jgi:hypothetical protein